jgi:cytochrome P450
MTEKTLFHQVGDYANRPNPYPLYAEMRKTPVAQDSENYYTVSTYREVMALLHDPRTSSERRPGELGNKEQPAPPIPPFIRRDPPEHDRLRRMAMRPFGPPHTPERIASLEPEIGDFVQRTIDGWGDRKEVDVVDDFAYPLPIMVICKLLGVPREGEEQFHGWVDVIVKGLDTATSDNAEELTKARTAASMELAQYLAGLVAERRKDPQDDMLSELANDDGPDGKLTDPELLTTAVLLLIAGHETTVNLITNGVLTLLRNPDAIDRLRAEPGLVVPMVEELLRFEPPVQFLPNRSAHADIEIDGVTIPKGAGIALMTAAANRDPDRFEDPDRFVPDRSDNQHLGFGSGIHNCFGAPLARLETQSALSALFERLEDPSLVEDPPEYRPAAVLRGPRHLKVAFSGLRS